MVSVCLPSDAFLQHLPSYLGFSYCGRWVSLHGYSSKAQQLLLTLDEEYLLTAALPDLQHGIAPLALLRLRSHHSLDVVWLLLTATVASDAGWLLSAVPSPTSEAGWLLPAATPDLGLRVAPLSRSCAVAAWPSQPLHLTSDVGKFLSAALSAPVAAACSFPRQTIQYHSCPSLCPNQ